jgi:hypothetical protein
MEYIEKIAPKSYVRERMQLTKYQKDLLLKHRKLLPQQRYQLHRLSLYSQKLLFFSSFGTDAKNA